MNEKWGMNEYDEGCKTIFSRKLILDYNYNQRKRVPCLNRPKTTLNTPQTIQTFGPMPPSTVWDGSDYIC